MFLSLALWAVSRPARRQALKVEIWTPRRAAVSGRVSRPRARSRSAWLGRWWLRRRSSTIRPEGLALGWCGCVRRTRYSRRCWRAQQAARGLRTARGVVRGARAADAPVRRVHRRVPWNWQPGHVDEWALSLTAEHHLAPSTIRANQGSLRHFNTYLCGSRCGWAGWRRRAYSSIGLAPISLLSLVSDLVPSLVLPGKNTTGTQRIVKFILPCGC